MINDKCLLPWECSDTTPAGSLGMQWVPLVPAALPRIKSSYHPQGIFQPWPANALGGTAQETRG